MIMRYRERNGRKILNGDVPTPQIYGESRVISPPYFIAFEAGFCGVAEGMAPLISAWNLTVL
ncbi:hypothetical protein AD947_05560 [Acetobacter tropicalis]|uniref:Uncharacterized protein n=1 Tax=Acetobacter tropicalis TaxID=104102 RepID=A0A149U064_9PROT|nr:hypothetical protein AD947_05560 [Acetobacter tropicalis]